MGADKVSNAIHAGEHRGWSFPPLMQGFAPAVTGAVRELQQRIALQALPMMDREPIIRPATSIIWTSTQASAFELQWHATKCLATVRADGDANPTRAALISLDNVIRALVSDNGPTPQVGATPSGSVEVQWLADGTLVSALFDESGDFNVYAVNADDEVLVDDELSSGDLPDDIRTTLAEILEEMSTKIVQRPPSWAGRG